MKITDWLVTRAHAAEFDWLNPRVRNVDGSTSIETLASGIIDIVLIVAAILAIGYLIYSGILYITAAGNPDAAKKGQQGVINAIIGIIIIVLAWFIAGFAVGVAEKVEEEVYNGPSISYISPRS